MSKLATAMLALLFVIAGLAQLGPGTSAQEDKGGAITIGLDLEPDSLDPAITPYAVSHTIMMNIFDTLVWQDNEGNFQPGLATSWEVNEDGTEYTFTLRDDVIFHDGTPFDAEAVKFTFDRVADPDTKSGFASTLLGPYDRSEVIDPQTVRVTFSSPAPAFLDGASQAFLGIVSPAAVEEFGEDFGRNPVGSGPFRFSEWVQQDRITLENNPDYNWAPDIFGHQGAAYLDSLTFRFYAEAPTRLAALQANDAQVIDAVAGSDISLLEGDSNYQLFRADALGLPNVVFLNTRIAPTDDVAVRQAVNYAIDRQAIIDFIYFGQATAATGPLAPRTPYYNSEVESLYPLDLDRANAVLDEAGWVMGDDGVRAKDGQRLTMIWGSDAWSANWAELIQSQLSQIGVEVQIEQMTAAAINEAAAADEINMVATAWSSSDPVVLSTVFHSRNIEGGYAYSHFASDELDALLETGEESVDPEVRAEAYGDAQMLIMEEGLIIPTTLWSQPVAAHASVTDLKRDFRNYMWLYDTYVAQ